jgi:hypothetical protein
MYVYALCVNFNHRQRHRQQHLHKYPTSMLILYQYQCRASFGALGYWLELDEGAAAIWWAEEPPHDVHGPG